MHNQALAPVLCLAAAISMSAAQAQAPEARVEAVLDQADVACVLKAGVLDAAASLPAGTHVTFPSGVDAYHGLYRLPSGKTARSSNGFYPQIQVVSVPVASQPQFPQSRIDTLNRTAGGLYISVPSLTLAPVGDMPALRPAPNGADYLKSFAANGRPIYKFTAKLRARFGSLNMLVPTDQIDDDQAAKWHAIFAQLARAADRTRPTPNELLFMAKSDATEASIRYEEQGLVSPLGAWTIAVKATAPRHGFGNVPCAEFVSEQIRQAYQRAGYLHTDDFNAAKGNELIWSNTAAVVNLSTALELAGWIAWDAGEYKPPTGAPAMQEWAQTPGHAYMIAGDDGRFIVDNGSPLGRDLRTTSAKVLGMMYHHGVFFLPPGINPERWDAALPDTSAPSGSPVMTD